MAFARLIPAMLLRGGRLVKGKGFADHEDAGNPVTTAKIYNDQMADEIVVLDIDASVNGKLPDLEILKSMSTRCFVPISFGGGVSDVDVASKVLRCGADKIIVNSAALQRSTVLSELADRFGRQAVVAAIDHVQTSAGTRVATKCGRVATQLTPAKWARQAEEAGAGEILLTSVDREGTRNGLDIETIRDVANAVSIPVVAHGGVGRLEDFVAAFSEAEASAVAAGRIFQFADNNLIKVRRYMQQNGIDLRRF